MTKKKFMEMDDEEKRKTAHSIYRECKSMFGDILDDWSDYVADEEERGFYHIVSTYFLQQRQKEVVQKGAF